MPHNKKVYNLENPEDVKFLLESIDDDMGQDSEENGDSDADDNIPLCDFAPSRSTSRSASRSTSALGEAGEGTSQMDTDEEEENDSDISEPHIMPREEMQSKTLSEEELLESEEECESVPKNDYNWKDCSEKVPDNFSKFIFQKPFGLYRQIDSSSPIAFFKLVLTKIFMQYIVDQSNLYAAQNSKVLDMTVDEFSAYLGILVIMGFHSLPSMRLYWSSDANFGVRRIQMVMTLKRFLKITRLLHVNDNSEMPKRESANFDKIFKIRPLLEYVDRRFKLIFNPSRFLSIDESMIRYKGRSSIKQYMPMKPIKRGFKVWVIACAVTGYCLGMTLYQGAEKTADKELSLGERVVNTLSRAFEGCGYCLFFDNFFSSVILAKRLLEKNFFSCATIRQTRKLFPKSYLKEDKKMKVGDMQTVTSGQVSISKWKDRGTKAVCVISTMNNPSNVKKVLRTQKDGARLEVNCPESVATYNEYMGGVDRFDQYLSTYSISWKSRRWWMRIFYYCIDACIVNSYIIYKQSIREQGRKPMTHLQYRSQLADELIGSFSNRKKPGPLSQYGRGRKKNNPDGRATILNSIRLNNVGLHLPVKGTRRRCAFCSTTANQKRSNMRCENCDVALCLECFKPFHKC